MNLMTFINHSKQNNRTKQINHPAALTADYA